MAREQNFVELGIYEGVGHFVRKFYVEGDTHQSSIAITFRFVTKHTYDRQPDK